MFQLRGPHLTFTGCMDKMDGWNIVKEFLNIRILIDLTIMLCFNFDFIQYMWLYLILRQVWLRTWTADTDF